MNIHIIGGGAVGLFFAAELSRCHQVTLQTKTKKQKELLDKEGICVKEKSRESVFFIKTAEKAPANTELLIIAVKQYHLASVLIELAPGPAVLFIQNGLSHLEQIKKLPHLAVYAASVEHGVAKQDGRTVQVNGRTKTKLANVKGGTEKLAERLGSKEFSFEWMEDVIYMLVDKMAANAVINPLTALLNVKNGELVENDLFRSALEALCSEFSSVFSHKTKKEIIKTVTEICLKTADNESSMLKDVKAGRQTEIDAIVGALLTEAKRKHVNTPSFQLLHQLVKGKTQDPL